MADLSIIIISYNTADITKRCLESISESLENAPFSTEIIVLDNASTDDSVKMLEEKRSASWRREEDGGGRRSGGDEVEPGRDIEPRRSEGGIKLKIIESKQNLGFSKGNNVAMKQSIGTYLLFLNSDTVVLDDAISSLYSFFTSTDNTFQFVGPKLLEKDGTTSQPSAGRFYTLPVVFTALFLRGDYWGLTRFSPNSTKRVDWVSGACFMCTREDFEKIGGFDEEIFMYMEEIDLFYRAYKKGMSVGFYPLSRFIHLSGSSSSSRTEPILAVYRGFLYFYKKYQSRLQLEVLRIMLQLKAVIALTIGAITNHSYLKKTYAEALKITTND